MNNWSRRKFISGAGVAGVATLTGIGSSISANPIPERESIIQDVEKKIFSFQDRIFNNVLYVDVANGPEMVQAAIDEADLKGMNKVIIYGQEAEWNKPVYLPSNFRLEILEGVKITSSMKPEDANPFEVGSGTICGALFTNKDHENGNYNISIKGGHIDFKGVTDKSIVWAPVWLHNCDHSLFDSILVENVVRSYGVMFSDCRNSIMTDCVARNIGYDGIAVRLDCRQIDIYRCAAYECGGPGIQAATFGRGAGATHDISFINCRTPENIFVHGYQGPGGARGVLIHGCTAGRIAMIGQVEDFTITSCKTTSIGLSCLNDTIRNGRIDSVSFSDLYGAASTQAVTRIRSRANGLIENIIFSNCSARSYGKVYRFAETVLEEAGASARYIDYVNCSFDGAGAEGESVFFQHKTEGNISKIRIHGCKIWNVQRIVEGFIDGVRIRDCELHNAGELHDGKITDLKTRDNDTW